MSVIKPHGITLYGGDDDRDIVLRPLTDDDLAYLYKWNADTDVTYYTESAVDLRYDENTVRTKYGGMSECAFCFLIEVNGAPVGECWLQKMNRKDVIEMYGSGTDVRRIDMCIGEKECWNRGIGTLLIGMMINFAFNGEHIDVLHCFCEDYNARSRRIWEKHGFSCVKEEPVICNPKWRSPIGKIQYHYRLTRTEYLNCRRYRPAEDKIFTLPLSTLQPSQLYISEGKLRNVHEWYHPSDRGNFDPIPLKKLDGRLVMTDGHTRAVAAYLSGWDAIPAYMDTDELDMNAYATDVSWCVSAGINSPADLSERIVSHIDYERLWRKRCMEAKMSQCNKKAASP